MHMPNHLHEGIARADLATYVPIVRVVGTLLILLYLHAGNLLLVVGFTR